MDFLNRLADPVYCLMRLIAGLLFACHGSQLVLGMFGGADDTLTLSLKVAGWIQLAGGLLIAFGFLTRLAALISSGHMAVAYFAGHAAASTTMAGKFFPIVNEGELTAFYCFLFLFIFFYGPGQWSIDASTKSSARRRKDSEAEPPGAPV